MRHARTFSRHARLAGYFACILAAFPVTAFASWSAQITDVRPTGNSTPTHIETRVSSNYRFSANDPRFYNRSLSLVSRQTVRTGALAALGRGVMHPGLAVAIAAAGYLYSQQHGIHELSSISDNYTGFEITDPNHYFADGYEFTEGLSWYASYDSSRRFSDPVQAAYRIVTGRQHSGVENLTCTNTTCYGDTVHHTGRHSFTIRSSTSSVNDSYDFAQVPNTVPESELSNLDQHLPDVLVREIYQADTYPEPWHESLDVSSLPLSQVASPNGQVAPEIFEDVAKWAENMTAQVNGDPEPHQGTNVAAGGNTAADQIVESIDENPPDDFPTVDDPVWVVDEIDELPDYDTGLTNYAQCRAPDVIEVPHFGSFELNWQPACDFATNISGPFKALGLLLGMFIVVGRR